MRIRCGINPPVSEGKNTPSDFSLQGHRVNHLREFFPPPFPHILERVERNSKESNRPVPHSSGKKVKSCLAGR